VKNIPILRCKVKGKENKLSFGSFSLGGITFVFISTDIISENENKKSPCEFENPELRQENFLAKTLYSTVDNAIVIVRGECLMAGETTIKKIIDSHREKINAIIYTE